MRETTSTRRNGFGRLRRWAAIVGLTGTAVLIHAAGVAPARADTPAPMHVLVAAHSGKAMDVPRASHTSGTQLIQWRAHYGRNQLFRALPFTTVGDAQLIILQSVESGLVLDVAGGATGEGAAVVQSPWAGLPSQVWWAPPFGPAHALYVNMGSGKVITVAGASQADGAPLVQSSWYGGLNQIWSVAATAIP